MMMIFFEQRLKLNFDTFLKKLSKREKIIVVLIPIILLIWLFFLFEERKKETPILQNTILNQKQALLNKKENLKKCKLEIMKSYESIGKKANIRFSSIKFDGEIVECEIGGKSIEVFNFLNTIEHFDTIVSLDFAPKNEILSLKCVFKVNTFTKREQFIFQPILSFKDPFFAKEKSNLVENIVQTEEKISKKTPIIISSLPIKKGQFIEEITTNKEENLTEILPKSKTVAFVGEYVLLDKKWLKVGDNYKDYTIMEITKNKITFQKEGKLAIQEMFDE